MDEAHLVSCLQAGSRLQDQVYRLVRGEEVACAEHLGEELTPERLEGDPLDPFLVLTYGADARDVRVLDPGSTVKLIPQWKSPGASAMGSLPVPPGWRITSSTSS